MKLVVFGLSVTSSWGNGHATTYRALLGALARRQHRIVFFEKNEPWYASNRDLPLPAFCDLRLFERWDEALPAVRRELFDCDAAVLGSFFPPGIRAADEIAASRARVKVFYDIDTPVTLAKLRRGENQYVRPDQIRQFDLYLSFTGGPILEQLHREFGARMALPLYCSFDPSSYFPRPVWGRYQCDLGYMGTYAADRQQTLNRLLCVPAERLPQRKFRVAGPQYPATLKWPRNVERIIHLEPKLHADFYSSSRVTLNITRKPMIEAGYSPSVRLFEAAGYGAAIVSDYWPGLETFLKPGEEILIANQAADVVAYIEQMDDNALRRIGLNAQERVLQEHSSSTRAIEFEKYIAEAARIGSPVTATG